MEDWLAGIEMNLDSADCVTDTVKYFNGGGVGVLGYIEKHVRYTYL